MSQFFHKVSPNTLPKDYSFGASNIDFTVELGEASTYIGTRYFPLKSHSNKKNFIAGRLAIDGTSVSFIDASKNCYTLKPSIDLFKTLFNADGECKKYLLASLAWILLVKQGFSTYSGKDFFQYPLPKEGVNCKIDRTRVVGTYTLTSAILMTV